MNHKEVAGERLRRKEGVDRVQTQDGVRLQVLKVLKCELDGSCILSFLFGSRWSVGF